MASETLQGLFIHPPIAVARLGASGRPLDSFEWIDSDDPHRQTQIRPALSLDVTADGEVSTRMPSSIVFRDGNAIRPVAPFFEVWALMGANGSDEKSWKQVPVTPALLKSQGLTLADISLDVEAKNGKAARRRGSADLIFGTFPPVRVSASVTRAVRLDGTNDPGVRTPLIPRGMAIPLGRVQFLKPGVEAPDDPANLAILRFRLWPPRGRFYGPPEASRPQGPRGNGFPAVSPDAAFLNASAGWAGQRDDTGLVDPSDTYDTQRADVSLGVVDDTSEVRFTITVRGKKGLAASATAFVAPPDFAPDRRPFLSIADELIDRSSRPSSPADDAWVQDLFERIFETTSLVNVDAWRNARGVQLRGKDLAPKPIAGDGISPVDQAFGARDLLRDQSIALAAPTDNSPLPITERAISRHMRLAELDDLRRLVAEKPDRLKALIRAPFQTTRSETFNATTMQMPPFMRQSNALPLTLSNWQYRRLMAWVATIPAAAAPAAAAPGRALRALSRGAQQRRAEVLDSLSRVRR